MENRQFEAMLAVAQERLAQHIPEDIAGKAGAQYADGSFSLKTLGQTVTVRLLDCTIQPPLCVPAFPAISSGACCVSRSCATASIASN